MNKSGDTREALLGAARRLFAETGYDGTSVRAITQAAGVNLGAITYHFGSKLELYHGVLSAAWGPILKRLEEVPEYTDAPLEQIQALVNALFVNLARHSEIAPIMLRELSQKRPVPPPIRDSVKRLFGMLTEMVERGQRSGSIAAGDPKLLTLSILAQPFHVLAIRHRMADVIGVPARQPEVFARIVENAVTFLRRGLSAPEHA